MLCCFSTFEISAQTKSSNEIQLDSITMSRLNEMRYLLRTMNPYYKMYQTENIHKLLKLDTATGRVWMVQYSLGDDTEPMTIAIDNTSLLWDSEEIVAGRYELYPTKNMFNFILLDTILGYTYQVQWNTSPEKRFRMRIY